METKENTGNGTRKITNIKLIYKKIQSGRKPKQNKENNKNHEKAQ